MFSSRRSFLNFAAATAAFGAGLPLLAQDDGDSSPHFPPDAVDVIPHAEADPRVFLEASQKNIQKDLNRLSDIVRDMQKRLNQSDTKNFLPLDVLRQTDEIERLAKHIRSLVRA